MNSTTELKRDLHYYELKARIEDFLYDEAEMLDERRFSDWLDVLADDLVYVMPIRRNVKYGEHAAHENTRAGRDICWFDEDKWTLSKRVEQLQTGIHWAEEPLSRVCHIVTNVQLVEARPSVEDVREAVVRSRFLIYQNRVETETYFLVGKRTDVLRKDGELWKIARREIILDQNVLLSKNLTVFF
ncbi:MAG TPA: 3-phenylpropionate/cinnamic acid dioxygenase subunit beta [Candidatus Acidoferrales bacterium]|nr:3-phenylpropionate/cinnamic acid dioxygenase subunit beta [Candidatus Acidoferrales bacterium]